MPATTTATELQRNYKKVVQTVKNSRKPLTVLSNNKPDLIVIDYDSFKNDYKKVRKTQKKKSDFSEFLGVWTKEEAVKFNRRIDEVCERIDVDEWK